MRLLLGRSRLLQDTLIIVVAEIETDSGANGLGVTMTYDLWPGAFRSTYGKKRTGRDVSGARFF